MTENYARIKNEQERRLRQGREQPFLEKPRPGATRQIRKTAKQISETHSVNYLPGQGLE